MSDTPAPDNAQPGEIHILVDADACPVKDEIYKVALRHNVRVIIVANSAFRIMQHALVNRVIVDDGFDAADDWIAERASAKTVVVTSDILLADRCIKSGASVLANNGKPFTENSIGGAVAARAIMEDLRAGMDGATGGPPPFSKADRSRFLQELDTVLVRMARR